MTLTLLVAETLTLVPYNMEVTLDREIDSPMEDIVDQLHKVEDHSVVLVVQEDSAHATTGTTWLARHAAIAVFSTQLTV